MNVAVPRCRDSSLKDILFLMVALKFIKPTSLSCITGKNAKRDNLKQQYECFILCFI